MIFRSFFAGGELSEELELRNYTLAALATTIVMVGALYIASPLLAAYKLRAAVQTGDTRTIERMIIWPSFRESVRHTIIHNANLLPVAEGAVRNIPPTLWQRVRSVFGHSLLDRFIERYISPQGLPELYRARSNWHQRPGNQPREVRQASVVPGHILVVPDHILNAWKRIKRAEFITPFNFVLETEDPHKTARLIRSTFQLTNVGIFGFDWKLSAVSVRPSSMARSDQARLNAF